MLKYKGHSIICVVIKTIPVLIINSIHLFTEIESNALFLSPPIATVVDHNQCWLINQIVPYDE